MCRKITKIVATRCQMLRLKCTKFDFGWGSAPDPAGGGYSTPPRPLAVLEGADGWLLACNIIIVTKSKFLGMTVAGIWTMTVKMAGICNCVCVNFIHSSQVKSGLLFQ